jgi:hypothetical protein
MFSQRLKLDAPNPRLVIFSLDEMREINESARLAMSQADSGMKKNSLELVVVLTEKAVDDFQGIAKIPVKERLYQFKIRLKNIKPPIWRRIQTRDCSLDKLHDRIQNAMGWTNSHLHQFLINKQLFGDPMLLEGDFGPSSYVDSTVAILSELLPRSGARFFFEYLYDFGDSWRHEVLFEGCLKASVGQRYPLCVEGERACPPEDVGGTSGYTRFLKAIARPEHREHEENLRWVGGSFDPEHFDPVKATKRMIRGLQKWRHTAY